MYFIKLGGLYIMKNQSKRKLISISRSENCIIFRTISKDGANFRYKCKSSHFYALKSEIENALNGGYAITRDICSFAVIRKLDDMLNIDFTWLESNGHKVEGAIESVYINLYEFIQWYYSDSEEYKTLNCDKHRTPKIKFVQTESLSKVLANSEVRRKFIKKLMEFQNYKAGTRIDIYNDWSDYSFYWIEYAGDKKSMNGGLIFHRDYNEPENLKKGYYGVHT